MLQVHAYERSNGVYITKGEHNRPFSVFRPDPDQTAGPIPIPTIKRFGSRFAIPAKSGVGSGRDGSGRDDSDQ